MFSPVKPPWLIRKYYNRFVWNMPAEGKNIYLTFDDGPVPQVTEFVLDTLDRFKVKATFFCIGNNVKKHPEIFKRIIDGGHRIGNHTFNHKNGWLFNEVDYVNDVKEAAELIESDLFRPPYGRIKKSQAEIVLKHYKIIMWDVLSYDYDKNITPERCYSNVVNNILPGSIIVFHDSVKAFKNLEYALPRCLDFFKQEGYATNVL